MPFKFTGQLDILTIKVDRPKLMAEDIKTLGLVTWLHVTRALQRNAQDQPLYSISVVQDISDRKRAEERLHEANERLAEANAKLSEADRRKDEFLAMLAHELRNPLAPIRNAVQVLRMTGPADPTTQRQKDVIDRQVSLDRHALAEVAASPVAGQLELLQSGLDGAPQPVHLSRTAGMAA